MMEFAQQLDTSLDTSDKEDLRLLYHVTVSDLSYFKTQQWNVSYYALLVEAGLIGVATVLPPPLTMVDRSVLAVLSILAASAALFVLRKLQKSISVRQARLEAVRVTFGEAFQRAWLAKKKDEDPIQSVYLLCGGITVTALLTFWLVTLRLGVT